MMYELKLEKFRGPLEKLLELIEERKLEISEISLAEVTADFLEYLKTLTDAETGVRSPAKKIEESQTEIRETMRLVADFIAVASRLLLIKSKSLLPDVPLTAEEESEIKDLEERLKMYRALRPAVKLISGSWRKSGAEFNRPYFLNALSSLSASGAAVFYPGSDLSSESIAVAASKIAEVIRKIVSEEETVKKEIISVEEKMKEIIERLQKFSEVKFSEISGRKPRSEIIAAFLAILHMAHEQLVFIEQKSNFSDIIIKKHQSSA